jgi:hypothetical protein
MVNLLCNFLDYFFTNIVGLIPQGIGMNHIRTIEEKLTTAKA